MAAKKPIKFHSSFEEQKQFGLQSSIEMNETERLAEMYRLNRKIYGKKYGKISKKTELYCAEPGESVEEFYKRINKHD